jgi:hypothetical protein
MLVFLSFRQRVKNIESNGAPKPFNLTQRAFVIGIASNALKPCSTVVASIPSLNFETLQVALVAPLYEELVERVDARCVDACAQPGARAALVVVVAGCAGFQERSIIDLKLNS